MFLGLGGIIARSSANLGHEQKYKSISKTIQPITTIMDLSSFVCLSVALGLIIGGVFPSLTFKAKLILLPTLGVLAGLELSPLIPVISDLIGRIMRVFIVEPISSKLFPS